MSAGSAPLVRRSASAAVVAAVLTAGGMWLFWLAGGSSLDAVRASGPDAPADLLVLGAAGVGAALLLWLGVGVTLAALAAIPGAVGRISAAAAERVTPAAVRRFDGGPCSEQPWRPRQRPWRTRAGRSPGRRPSRRRSARPARPAVPARQSRRRHPTPPSASPRARRWPMPHPTRADRPCLAPRIPRSAPG